jgi:hypothetical protein
LRHLGDGVFAHCPNLQLLIVECEACRFVSLPVQTKNLSVVGSDRVVNALSGRNGMRVQPGSEYDFLRMRFDEVSRLDD